MASTPPGTAHRTALAGLAAVASLGVALAMAGLAWACTPAPRVSVFPASAPVAGEVMIKGESVPASAPIVIRWNGLGEQPAAATTSDKSGAFAVALTVPDGASPGVYSLLVDAGVGVLGRVAVEVEPSPGAAPAARGAWEPSVGGNAAQGSSRTSEPSRSGLAVGAALVGLGVVAMSAAFAAGARRRHALAGSAR